MKTIFTLSIECVWGAYLKERFHRVVEVPGDMTLGELHYFMQELTGFDDDHMSTFYAANRFRGKKTGLTETGEWDDGGDDMDGAMWDIPLHRVFPLPKKQKLYYWFDFGDDWTFEIKKKGKETAPLAHASYPRVIHEEGPKPVQYPMFEE